MWGAGVATGTSLIIQWRVVGPGYVWLAGSVTVALAAVHERAGDLETARATALAARPGLL